MNAKDLKKELIEKLIGVNIEYTNSESEICWKRDKLLKIIDEVLGE